MAFVQPGGQVGVFVVAVVLLLNGAHSLAARDFPVEAEVVKIEDLNYNIRRVTLKPKAKDFEFTAGQYLYLKAPDDYIATFNEKYKTDHSEVSRPYSFASSPEHSDSFALIIKHYGPPRKKPDVPPGVVSTYVHKHLKVGDSVKLSEPRGRLYARNDSERPIVLLAGGVGISPFVGLLTYFFENKINEKRKIYLFYGARTKRDLALDEQFRKWAETEKNFHYVPSLDRPADDWKGKTGYVNQVFDAYFTENIDADVYMAGSPNMVKFTIPVLMKKGIPEDQIHRDRIKVGEDD